MPQRYDYEKVALEIAAVVARAPRGTKARLAAALSIAPPDFRHKLIQYRGERFTVEQIGAIAAELGAPVAWPFIPWAEAERISAIRKLLEAESATKRH